MAELFLAPLFTWRSAIASEQGPGPTTRHVLLTLSLHMSERGDSCWPSQDTLAMETGLSLRAVKEHLKLAHQQGWISSRDRHTNGKAWRHKEYFSLLPASFHVKHGGAPAAPAKEVKPVGGAPTALPDAGAPNALGSAPDALGGAPDGKNVVHQMHTSSSVNSTKNSKSIAVGDAHPLFDEAWKLYPKRNGNNPKSKALKAWNARVAAGVKPEDMLAGVVRYAAWCEAGRKTDTEWVLLAATFFGPDMPFTQAFTIIKPAGPEWHETAPGIIAKGKELGIIQGDTEHFQYFRQRVHAAVEAQSASVDQFDVVS